MRFRLRKLSFAKFATGFAAGLALWAATAPGEAWDRPFYFVWVAMAGLIATFCQSRGFYWAILGLYFGQVAALYVLIPWAGVPIFPPMIGVLLFGTIPAFIGALIGFGIGLHLEGNRSGAERQSPNG